MILIDQTSPTGDDPIVVALTTWPADRDPTPLMQALVEERLAACVNALGEIRSCYRWQGKVETETERQLVIKTTRGRLNRLASRLSELHPYEVPELIVLPVAGGSNRYLAWVRESVSEG